MLIPGIIALLALCTGFLLAWILKPNKTDVDHSLLQQQYEQAITVQQQQSSLIESLRTAEKTALNQAAVFETRYLEQQQELERIRTNYREAQRTISVLEQEQAGNAVKLQSATAQVSRLEQKTEELNLALQASTRENQQAHTSITELHAEVRSRQLELQMQQENMERLEKRIAELNQTQLLEFKTIATRILEDNTQKFTTVNEEKMNAVLNPFKTSIHEFKKQVEETYNQEARERHSLTKEIDKLVKQSVDVSQQAANLTNALKNNNKQQGNFGEMILESILENSGLIKGSQYVTQEFLKDNAGRTIKDEEGNGLQPDVMVICPDKRKIIIDSKVSLTDYENYVNAENKADEAPALARHVQSVKNHINQLSKKNYPRYAEALDYVLMFMPVEPAFLEALKADTGLWKYAYDKGIVLVSPTNLLAVLKIIQEMWKVDSRNQHAEQIAQKAGEVYEKFEGFLRNFDSIGTALQSASNAYQDGYKQLSTGRGNLSQKVQDLKNMGGKTLKTIPDKYLKEE